MREIISINTPFSIKNVYKYLDIKGDTGMSEFVIHTHLLSKLFQCIDGMRNQGKRNTNLEII